MVANPSIRCIIRDGVEADIARCQLLDHTYETDQVLQIHISQDDQIGWDIDLKRERLPQKLELSAPKSANRLRESLADHEAFLVAEQRLGGEMLGYLAMQNDQRHKIGLIHDFIVDRPQRRAQVGMKLLGAARTWAKEQSLLRLTVEVQSKNTPAIAFFQAMGFVFCGFNDRYFPNQDIAIFFSLSLR